MKNWILLRVLGMVAFLLLVGGCSRPDCERTEKWEYLVVDVNDAPYEMAGEFSFEVCQLSVDSLNALGKDGWGLVQVQNVTGKVLNNSVNFVDESGKVVDRTESWLVGANGLKLIFKRKLKGSCSD